MIKYTQIQYGTEYFGGSGGEGFSGEESEWESAGFLGRGGGGPNIFSEVPLPFSLMLRVGMEADDGLDKEGDGDKEKDE